MNKSNSSDNKNQYYEQFKSNEVKQVKRKLVKRKPLNSKKELDRIVRERREQRNTLSEDEKNLSVNPPRNRSISQRRMQASSTYQFSTWVKGGYYGTRHKPDMLLFYLTLLLIAVGLVMVYSASSYKALLEDGNAAAYFSKQFKFMLLGFLGMFVAYKIPIFLTERFAFYGFLFSIFLMILVMLIGTEVDGAVRWIEFKGIRFSPSDLAKLFGVIYFAQFLRSYDTRNLTPKEYLTILAVFAILPVMIVIEDLGTGLTLAGALFVMIILSGVPVKYLWGTILGGFGGVILAIIVRPYRISRLTGFLNPFSPDNISKDGWQLVQSLYAFASGGLFGSGLGNGGQKLLYLPAMHTDFIFSVYAEEMGFIGAVALLAVFLSFIIRGLMIASHLENGYLSLTVAGLTSVIGIQALINISVSVGVFPITGITLPFISYGGTSLVVVMTIVGFILNLSQYTKENRP